MVRRLALIFLFLALSAQLTFAQATTHTLPAALGATYEATVDLALEHNYIRYDPEVTSRIAPTSLISSDLALRVNRERVLLRFDEKGEKTSVVAEFAHGAREARQQVEAFFRTLETKLRVTVPDRGPCSSLTH